MIKKKAKTIVVEGRVDLRSLATIAKFLYAEGAMPETRSGLVSKIIEDYCDLLVSNNLGIAEESTMEAFKTMNDLGFNLGGPSRSGKRNRKAYLTQIQAETIQADQVGTGPVNLLDSDEAKEAYERLKASSNNSDNNATKSTS